MGICVSKIVSLPCARQKLLIARLRTPEQVAEAQKLLKIYGATRPNDPALTRFGREMAGLPGDYAPPGGEFLLAYLGDRPVGCVAMRRIDRTECEMKRLFNLPEYRGIGIGSLLVSEIVSIARQRGYSVMRLDTLPRLKSAQKIYEAMGFVSTEPYHFNPHEDALFFALDLKAVAPTIPCQRSAGARVAR